MREAAFAKNAKTKQPGRLKAAFLLGNFMQQITITVGDDGTMTVETSEGGAEVFVGVTVDRHG